MEFFGLLSPLAFILSLSAIAQLGALKKEVEKLKEGQKDSNDSL